MSSEESDNAVSPGEVTQLLGEIDAGRVDASQLLPLVYRELRRLASARMKNERAGHTLQPTALVHEAYVRLVGGESPSDWDSGGHFFAAAAEAGVRASLLRPLAAAPDHPVSISHLQGEYLKGWLIHVTAR